jgi:hypothetical protein
LGEVRSPQVSPVWVNEVKEEVGWKVLLSSLSTTPWEGVGFRLFLTLLRGIGFLSGPQKLDFRAQPRFPQKLFALQFQLLKGQATGIRL